MVSHPSDGSFPVKGRFAKWHLHTVNQRVNVNVFGEDTNNSPFRNDGDYEVDGE